MRNYYIVIWCVISFCLTACNSLNDLQPMPEDHVPASVIEELKSKFPNAQQTIYKTVEEDKLWEVTFISDDKKYYVALASSGIIASHVTFESISSDTFDSLVEKISFPQGKFSNFRANAITSNVNTSFAISARYVVGTKQHLFTWYPFDNSRKKFVVTVGNYYKFKYTINILSNLPPASQKLFKENNLIQKETTVYVDETNKKRYASTGLSAGNKTVDYLFDQNGKIEYSSQNFTDTYNKSSDFPPFAQEYIAANARQFTDFPIQSGVRFEDNGQIGYRFILYKASPNLETYYLYFDALGKLNYLTYEALVTL